MVKPTLEGEGIRAVALAFDKALRWYPRELPRPDFGIDLHVEAAAGGKPNGRFLAVQVKGGSSYFGETTPDGIVFRDATHLTYWLNHSMPVIVALYNPESEIAYWQVVNEETFVNTGKGWKMTVPWEQRIDADSSDALTALVTAARAQGKVEPYLARFRELRADLEWMKILDEGERVVLDVEEWINKLSGRATVRLSLPSKGVVTERSFFAPGMPYEQLLPELFPWADLEVDQETYDDADRARWDVETGAWDSEDGRYITHSVDFEEWRAGDPEEGIRPYEEDGEIARWRLALRLNELGRAFLVLDEYAGEGESRS